MLGRVLIIGVAASLAVLWYLTLPPRGAVASTDEEAAIVRGAIHVHTTASDGTGTVDEVAADAARAGLDFVVFTDHGDGTRKPEAPSYRSGVLCIDGVEISTSSGHVVALGLAETPYPLGGEGRDVLEDIRRFGGFAIAAHPGSDKGELRWSDWSLAVDGVEWINADSEWRDESSWSLIRALLEYPIRPTESLAGLLDRPDPILQRWDEALRTRRVVSIAAADAHARIGPRTLGEPYETGAAVHAPAYERVFRLFSNVLPDVVLSRDAITDAAVVLDAIRKGRLYSRLESLAPSGTLAFGVDSEGLTASLSAASNTRITLVRDGQHVAASDEPRLRYRPDAPGAYRVEVSVPQAPGTPPVPWIVSNPVYVGRDVTPPIPSSEPAAVATETQYSDGPADRWAVETSPASRAAVDVLKTPTGTQLGFRYALGGRESSSAYAALAMISGSFLSKFNRLSFKASASRPMRLSVQLRAPVGTEGERWQRSVFVDEIPRDITVRFDDLRPAGPTRSEHPSLEAVNSILFVVDTVNTPLGANGRLFLDDVRYVR